MVVEGPEPKWDVDKFIVSGRVQFGFKPSEGQKFQPLIEVKGTVSWSELVLAANGEFKLVAFPEITTPTLFSGSWEIDVGKAVTRKLSEAAQQLTNDLSIAGIEIVLDGLSFGGSFSDPRIEIQGSMKMPDKFGGFTVAIKDPHKIVVNKDGLSFTGGKLSLEKGIEIAFFGHKVMKAEALSLEFTAKTATQPETWKIQGKVSLPIMYDAMADLSGDNFILISNGDFDVKGEFSVADIAISPGLWEIKGAKLTIDTTQSEIKGEATIKMPSGITVTGGLGFVDGELNFVKLVGDNLNVAIDATGAFLQKIGGQVDHIAEKDPKPIAFGGTVGATAGPQKNIQLPQFLGGTFQGTLLRLDVEGTVDANHLVAKGKLLVVGGLVQGDATAEINWTKGFISADATLSSLGGALTYAASFKATSDLNITMRGKASLKIPEGIRFIGGTEVGSANALLVYRNDSISSNDYIAGWGKVAVLGELGIKVTFDGEWETLGGEEIKSLPTGSGQRTNVSQPAGAQASGDFPVPSGRPWVLLVAEWDNATGDVPIQLTDPTGAVISESDISSSGDISVVADLTGPTKKTVMVANPAAGNWTITVLDTTGLGVVELGALAGSASPTIEITSPVNDVTGDTPGIQYTATDPDSQARLALFYDDDRTGFDGLVITVDLVETDGPGSFSWPVAAQGVPAGDYYVYAMIEDDHNPPVFSDYSIGRVRVIDPDAPAAVTDGLVRWKGADQVELSWSSVADVDSYLISFTPNAAGEFYSQDATTRGMETDIVLDGLIPGETYRLLVQAVKVKTADGSGVIGQAGAPVSIVVGPSPDIPPSTGEWPV